MKRKMMFLTTFLLLLIAVAVPVSLQAAPHGGKKVYNPREFARVPDGIVAKGAGKIMVDARILNNVRYIANTYDLKVTQGRAAYPPSRTHGDGASVDFGGSNHNMKRAYGKLQGVTAIYEVKYNPGSHLHVRWVTKLSADIGSGKLVPPRKWVMTFSG